MKRPAIALALGLAALMPSARSHAGVQQGSFVCSPKRLQCIYNYCYYQPATCYGTFASARNSPDPDVFAHFTSSSSGASTFVGYYAGTYYTCTANSTTAPLWTAAIANRGYFSVTWDDSSNCTSVSVTNGSEFASF